jgi:hypothetical protein
MAFFLEQEKLGSTFVCGYKKLFIFLKHRNLEEERNAVAL